MLPPVRGVGNLTRLTGSDKLQHIAVESKLHGGPFPKWSALLDDVGNAMSVGKQVRVNGVPTFVGRKIRSALGPGSPSRVVPAVIGKRLHHPTKQIAKRSIASWGG